MITVVNGDSLHIPLADKSCHMCVTSPPYWSLRDYSVVGQLGLEKLHDCLGWATGNPCGECFVCHVVAWEREVKRVLRDDGTFWLNLGDSYGAGGGAQVIQTKNASHGLEGMRGAQAVKPKDMCGIPWRVALALQADGWYLRSDIIWSKPNPMPESVTDRPTKSHEYLFLLAKSQHYYYDADAIREALQEEPHAPGNIPKFGEVKRNDFGTDRMQAIWGNPAGRNRRTVWTIATAPYSGGHFATFPPKLVEPCIRAGTSERGCCPTCGKQWTRVVEKTPPGRHESEHQTIASGRGNGGDRSKHAEPSVSTTLGWQQSCTCPPHEPVPCTVLDPFAGSGTTGQVCARLSRSFIGVELNFEYIDLAKTRTSEIQIELKGL